MTPAGRYAHIDSLRAIAALLVVWTHVSEAFAPFAHRGAWLADLAHSLDLGRAGVVTFFAISGFVIPSSLRGPRHPAARAFLIRRFFRLYPAYWLSIPFAALTSFWIWNKPTPPAMLAANFTMIQEALGFASVEGLYWTLQTELVFYAVCLALFWYGLLHRAATLRTLILTGALLFPVLIALRFPLTAFLALHLSIMFWGALWRQWQEGAPLSATDRWLLRFTVPAWILATAAIAIAVPHIFHFPASYVIGLGIFALGSTALPIRARRVAWTGEVSYSLYLFHPVVFYSVLWLAQRSGAPWLRELHVGFWIALCAALSIAAAACVFYTIERPAMALGKRYARNSS